MTQKFKFHLKPLMLAETATSALLSGDIGNPVVERVANYGGDHPSKTKAEVGVITIRGPLYTSTYEKIGAMFDLAASGYDAVILDIDSPGGLVTGCFDLSDKIYMLRQKIPIYTVIREGCYSAAYCLASATTKIFLSRSAGAGSIGVIAVHMDQSGFDSKVGLKYTPIYSGSKKNDMSPHTPLSEQAMKDLKRLIDSEYDVFCQTVARNRGMSVDDVQQTEAGIFHGKEAVDKGLVDVICSKSEALESIARDLDTKGKSMASATGPTPKAEVFNPAPAKPKRNLALIEDARARAAATSSSDQPQKAAAFNSAPAKSKPNLSLVEDAKARAAAQKAQTEEKPEKRNIAAVANSNHSYLH